MTSEDVIDLHRHAGWPEPKRWYRVHRKYSSEAVLAFDPGHAVKELGIAGMSFTHVTLNGVRVLESTINR